MPKCEQIAVPARWEQSAYRAVLTDTLADGEATSPYLFDLHRRTLPCLHTAAVCAGATLRRPDRTHARTPLRPTQSGREARGWQAAQVRRPTAPRSDEGHRAVLNTKRGGGGREGRRAGVGAKRTSGPLGLMGVGSPIDRGRLLL